MQTLTLMVVHAHPDDESISTGGTLARYSAEGVRTVLVTCTDGGCGDGPGGAKPGEPGHDRAAVVAERRRELERSCRALGVHVLETLDYPDSGMMGWADNDAPGSFWSTPVDEAASRLAGVMERYQPQVVVTYDPNGFYGHPDHIQAHRITVAAVEASGIPDKLYYTAVPRSMLADFGRRLADLGVDLGTPGGEGPDPDWGTPDAEITTYLDVGPFTGVKFESLECHASQAENIFFVRMGREAFGELMAVETFVRARDRSGADVPESDLFAGLRQPGGGGGTRGAHS
ncbi:MAG TPA: PIG-L family deacetylase [Acidimicrobiales bacterium]|nr:PIG-L family deacetylase [Acidimicrobiales bacterium]